MAVPSLLNKPLTTRRPSLATKPYQLNVSGKELTEPPWRSRL